MASSLSDTQTRYLAIAWLCFEAEPKIDYTRFAELAGLKSAASGREMLRQTKKKLLENAPSDGTAAAGKAPVAQTPKKTAAKGKGKGSKKRKTESDDDAESDEGTPLKKPKKVIKDEPVDEDDGVAGAEEEAEA